MSNYFIYFFVLFAIYLASLESVNGMKKLKKIISFGSSSSSSRNRQIEDTEAEPSSQTNRASIDSEPPRGRVDRGSSYHELHVYPQAELWMFDRPTQVPQNYIHETFGRDSVDREDPRGRIDYGRPSQFDQGVTVYPQHEQWSALPPQVPQSTAQPQVSRHRRRRNRDPRRREGGNNENIPGRHSTGNILNSARSSYFDLSEDLMNRQPDSSAHPRQSFSAGIHHDPSTESLFSLYPSQGDETGSVDNEDPNSYNQPPNY
ncbi:hypothetical protein ACQ4LE_007427 [Meloidogyne hapla]